MANIKPIKLLVAGGGTGGHVLAGVAIADAWRAHHGAAGQVLFVGARGGLEEKLVPQAGYSLQLLSLGSLNHVNLKRKLKTFFQLPVSFFKATQILFQYRPDAVIGVGGYASGPIVLIAKLLKSLKLLTMQTGILEQNSIPGLTNRILGRIVDRIFIAFPSTEKKFPKKEVVLTGNPIRSSMKLLPPAQTEPFTIFIFGGSQGAAGINRLVLESLKSLTDLSHQIRWIHQTGVSAFSQVEEGYRKAGILNARVEKFVNNMPETYAQASLLICRAGSSTLAEIAAVGRATILIPLPTAADNHQEANAKIFSAANAAILINQNSTNGELLAQIIRELISNSSKIHEMEKNVTRFYRAHAATDVVKGLLN